ncbi:MAG: sensor histidine kinase, partial [Anaerolineales bacterium]
SLTAFGASLLSHRSWWRRASLLFPLTQAAIWAIGAFVLRGIYPLGPDLMAAGEAWTRYALAVPAAAMASLGLILQQRAFRRAGMVRFGRDSLWAAVGFLWYGMIGQMVVNPSPLPPSSWLNTVAFQDFFGFPVELLRAGAALMSAVFVMRFLRSFEFEIQGQLEELRSARLKEAERRQELRGELLRRVVSAQEAERKRMARELHDDTGQTLTAIGLGLRAVSRMIDQEPTRAQDNLDHLEGLVNQSLEELQRMIADLRPSHLDDLGLAAALRWYAQELESRDRLQVNVNVEGEVRRLEPAVGTALFRIAQEALTNVIKHAQTDQAEVRLRYAPDVMLLQVVDHGRGFDQETLEEERRSSFGLLGMQERAELLGGALRIVAEPGQGTRIHVSIPCGEGGVFHDG